MALRSDGLKIKLRRIPGITDPDLLKYDYYFQCPPTDEISTAYGHNSTSYNVIPSEENNRGGTFKRMGGRKLRSVTFTTIVVDYADFMIKSHFDANRANKADQMDKLIDRLQHLSENGCAFQMLASHDWNAGPEIDWAVTLPDLIIREREPGSRYVDITFEEYRDPIVTRKDKQSPRPGGKTFPKTHKLDANDTLYGLAKEYYGKSGSGKPGATAIAKKNSITNWGFGTKLIEMKRFKKGDKIQIPAPPQDKK